jgi:hypothetical protein
VPGTLFFARVDHGRQIEVRRDDLVSDDFWRNVRAEWGQMGANPNLAVSVPIEIFSSRQGWLPGMCRRHGVTVSLDEGTRALVKRGGSERERMRSLRAAPTQEPSQECWERASAGLAQTRFARDLRSFQTRDLARLLELDHGANFSVPGAGKTTVELAVYESERTAGRVDRLLVVAPLSAFDAWMQDGIACLSPSPIAHRYAGGAIPPSTELLLVTYQRLVVAYDRIAAWVQAHATLVVLDEAHRMKRGHDGEWGKACLDLAFLAARRDVLTGTPAPQHPSDLTALIDFLWPGQAQRVLPPTALVAQPTPAAVAQVTPAIAPLFVRTTKHELELKQPRKQIIRVPLEGLQGQIYTSLRTRFSDLARTQRDRVALSSWSEVTMYLLEAATNPALLPAGSSSADPIQFRHPPLPVPEDATLHHLVSDYASYETPAKLVQLAALIEQLRGDGRKVLVWSNFVRNLETLERMLAVHQPALVHGGIPSEITQPGAPRVREHEIDRFRTDPSCGVLLANPAAMGEGVSLHQVCHDMIYLERTFNAGQYLQSVDRIHRLGLERSTETNIYFLITEGTIDEAVSARVELKSTNLGTMLDDPAIATMALPDEEDVGDPIDVGDHGDIAALFAHLRGEPDGE